MPTTQFSHQSTTQYKWHIVIGNDAQIVKTLNYTGSSWGVARKARHLAKENSSMIVDVFRDDNGKPASKTTFSIKPGQVTESKTIITKQALKEFVRSVLDDPTMGAVLSDKSKSPDAVNVNNVVDPSEAETNTTGQDHRPQNNTELQVAIKQLTKDNPDATAPGVYDAVKKAVGHDVKKATSTQPTKPTTGTKEENMKNDDTQAEALIRSAVRKALREEFESYDRAVEYDEDDENSSPPHHEEQSDEKSFDDIASELGMSIAGAKQFVDKARSRWKFMSNLPTKSLKMKSDGTKDVVAFEPPESGLEDIDIMMLMAWNDYVELLNSSGETTPSDVQMMHDHPEVALELPGFRDFLHEYIMGAAKPIDHSGKPWLGAMKDDVDPELNTDKPVGKRSGKRTFQNAPDYEGDFDWLDPEDPEYKKVKRKAGSRAIAGASAGDEE